MIYSSEKYSPEAADFLFDKIVGCSQSFIYGYRNGNQIAMRVKNHYSNPIRFQDDIDNGFIIVDVILPEDGMSVAKNNDFYDDMEMMDGKGFQYEVQDGEDLNDVVSKIQQFINSL